MSKFNTTGRDFKQSYKSTELKLRQLESKIRKRLSDLIKQHPNAIIYERYNTIILVEDILTIENINRYCTNDCIDFIILIENWLLNQNPHKQLDIKFN